MKNRDISLIHGKIEEAVNIAKQRGCQMIGFGGFSSIVTRNCKSLYTNSVGFTTGNSLTVAMGVEALVQAAEEKGIRLGDSTLAVIGAKGNIASTYSECMADRVAKIILIGNPGSENGLHRVAGRIYDRAFMQMQTYFTGDRGDMHLTGIAERLSETRVIREALEQGVSLTANQKNLLPLVIGEMGDETPVICSTTLDSLKKARLIVSASNAPGPIVFPEMLGPGPIAICDIAVPVDIDPSVTEQRGDVDVLMGGLVKLPLNPEFSIGGIPLEQGESFACLAETLLLGLEGRKSNYSYGSVSRQQVEEIMGIARRHGFSPGRAKTEQSY